MNLLNIINKKAAIALIIAATGIPASLANAQFKVEYSSKAEAAPTVKDTKKNNSVTVVESHDDSHVYKVKIVNGEIEIAELDGEALDEDRVKVKNQIALFFDDNGEVIHEIKMPAVHTTGKAGMVVVGEQTKPKVMLGINLGEPSKILRKHLKLDDNMKVILVEKVIDNLPAKMSGMQDYDVIVSIDGSDQATDEILRKVLSEKDAGDTMKVVVLRGGEKMTLKVKLAAYNAKDLGVEDVEISEDFEFPEVQELTKEFEILSQLENGEFGQIKELELGRLKEHLQKQLTDSSNHQRFIIDMQSKATDAMKKAERQMVELRNGKLFVQSVDELNGHMDHLQHNMDEFHSRLNNSPDRFPEVIHEHMNGMNSRLEALESRLDRQLDAMTQQIDRLAEMFGRLMESLEEMND
tara:strand:- start:306920 stop:308146 length:1227 start_codon:yes stop_codon:yes gene_type:complete